MTVIMEVLREPSFGEIALCVNELTEFGKTCLTFDFLVLKVQVVIRRITGTSCTLPLFLSLPIAVCCN